LQAEAFQSRPDGIECSVDRFVHPCSLPFGKKVCRYAGWGCTVVLDTRRTDQEDTGG
jgi:hypothetical protein